MHILFSSLYIYFLPVSSIPTVIFIQDYLIDFFNLGLPSATLAIMGRFAINISYNIGLQYAAEILPTVVRAQGVALIHIMGYVASIIAPFVVYLVRFYYRFGKFSI